MKKNLPKRARRPSPGNFFEHTSKPIQKDHFSHSDRGNVRRIKRHFRYIFFIFVLFFIILFIGLGVYFMFKKISFSFIIPIESKEIVKPIVVNATIEDFESLLKKSQIYYKSLTYSEDGNFLVLEFEERTKVFFSLERDPIYQVSSLQSILKRLTIDNVSKEHDQELANKPSKIDFRYNKPIVVF